MLTNEQIEEMESKIIAALPSGSGINYKWDITITKGAIIGRNKYDYMNENGYYDGVFPFSVKFTPEDIRLHFHINPTDYKKINNIQLRDYLETLFYEALPQIKPFIITGKKYGTKT